jgi:hypothetical protein
MASRKFNNLIFLTILGSILSIVVLGASVGTNNWYESKAVSTGSDIITETTIQYGLFAGSKDVSIDSQNPRPYDLKVVCNPQENACMFSCGWNSENRRSDLDSFLGGGSIRDTEFCINNIPPSALSEDRLNDATPLPEIDKSLFLNFALWLMTLIFLFGGILFSVVAGTLALYNTYRAPSQTILSVDGIYIWNGLSAVCSLMVMILWGVAFSIGLKKNSAVSQTLSEQWETRSSKLGYSFWIIILAELLCLANIGILRYRKWKILQIENSHHVVDEKKTNPEVLLF